MLVEGKRGREKRVENIESAKYVNGNAKTPGGTELNNCFYLECVCVYKMPSSINLVAVYMYIV